MAIGPLSAVRIFVSDLAAARAFYAGTLGLRLAGDGDVLLFDTGQAQLIVEPVARDDREARDLIGRFAGVSFAVTDADAACRALAARGVRIVGMPERQAWSGILTHIADPDGNVLTLVQLLASG